MLFLPNRLTKRYSDILCLASSIATSDMTVSC